jgi:hypothetical protein
MDSDPSPAIFICPPSKLVDSYLLPGCDLKLVACDREQIGAAIAKDAEHWGAPVIKKERTLR